MKYKILISERLPAFIKNLFTRTDSDFSCTVVSTRSDDIKARMDSLRPDAYICFYEQSDGNMPDQLMSLKNDEKYGFIPIVVIGDSDSCEALSQKAPQLSVLKINKSESFRNITEQIKRYLKEHPIPAAMKKAPAEPEDDSSQAAAALGISLDDLKKSFTEVKKEKKHILVVDDDRGVLKMLKEALGEKYDVTTMVNGKMIEKFIETKQTDLILLDYEMPEESGAEIFKRLRLQLKVKKIPVIFLTGVADSEKIKDVLALRPKGYLLKPIDMARLMSSIENALK